MSKDAAYYLSRLEEKASECYAKNLAGKSDQEFLDAYAEFADHHSWQALSSRIGLHFNEARAIVSALLEEPNQSDPAEVYSLVWIDRMSEQMGKGELMQVELTRSEMLDRLHWISSEEFGEDLDEWKDWMAAFETNPPPTGHR